MLFRRVFFLTNAIFWTVFLGIIVIVSGPADFRGHFVGWITRVYSKILLASSGVKHRVVGLDRLDRNSHYIFASNHESAFDIPLIFGGLPFHIVSFAKKELKKIPIFGWAMVAARHIFINRYNRTKARESLEQAKASLDHNPRSVIIFPEGTRSEDGEIHQFKKGGLSIAIDLGMDVVPLAVCGTRDVLAKRSFALRPGEVELRVGAPISVVQWKEHPKSEFAETVRECVVAMKRDWASERVVSSLEALAA